MRCAFCHFSGRILPYLAAESVLCTPEACCEQPLDPQCLDPPVRVPHGHLHGAVGLGVLEVLPAATLLEVHLGARHVDAVAQVVEHLVAGCLIVVGAGIAGLNALNPARTG